MAAHLFASSLLALIASGSMWHSALGMTLPSSLKATSGNRDAGTTADLSEAGYHQILSTGSIADLTVFARRVLDPEMVPKGYLHHFLKEFMQKVHDSSVGKTFEEFKGMLLSSKDKSAGLKHEEKEDVVTAPNTNKDEEVATAPNTDEDEDDDEDEEKEVAKTSNEEHKHKRIQHTKTRKDNTPELSINTTTADACPAGYSQSTKNLQGVTAQKNSDADPVSCGEACDARAGCTSFELGNTTQYAGCWTYMAGATNVLTKEQATGWMTCIRDAPAPCPDRFYHAKHNLDGGLHAGKLYANAADALACAAACENHGHKKNRQCTSFEFGSVTEGSNPKGCWAYVSGSANVATASQEQSWVSCLRLDVSNPFVCPAGYAPSNYSLNGTTAEKNSTINALECGAVCSARPGCKAFEVGITTSDAGCWTYTGGAANQASTAQVAGWITCIQNPTDSPTDSPTESPTASSATNPIATPTDAPTESPTVSPTANPTATKNSTASNASSAVVPVVPDPSAAVSASGDPHMINVHGESFDIITPSSHDVY